MKSIYKIVIVISLILFLLIPIPVHLKDGGSIEYTAILYKVTKLHRITTNGKYMAYENGKIIEILHHEVYRDVDNVEAKYLKYDMIETSMIRGVTWLLESNNHINSDYYEGKATSDDLTDMGLIKKENLIDIDGKSYCSSIAKYIVKDKKLDCIKIYLKCSEYTTKGYDKVYDSNGNTCDVE